MYNTILIIVKDFIKGLSSAGGSRYQALDMASPDIQETGKLSKICVSVLCGEKIKKPAVRAAGFFIVNRRLPVSPSYFLNSPWHLTHPSRSLFAIAAIIFASSLSAALASASSSLWNSLSNFSNSFIF